MACKTENDGDSALVAWTAGTVLGPKLGVIDKGDHSPSSGEPLVANSTIGV